jgi:formiminotetrahydrofolate cyclodeaminase
VTVESGIHVDALLDTEAPAGSAAALAAALAARITRLAAERAGDDGLPAAAAQADALVDRLERLAEAGRAAHVAASAALRQPDEAGEALGSLLQDAAAIPLKVCEAASDVAVLAASVAGLSSDNSRTDAAAAASLAAGAAAMASHLVQVNLAVAEESDAARRARQLETDAAESAAGARSTA